MNLRNQTGDWETSSNPPNLGCALWKTWLQHWECTSSPEHQQTQLYQRTRLATSSFYQQIPWHLTYPGALPSFPTACSSSATHQTHLQHHHCSSPSRFTEHRDSDKCCWVGALCQHSGPWELLLLPPVSASASRQNQLTAWGFALLMLHDAKAASLRLCFTSYFY